MRRLKEVSGWSCEGGKTNMHRFFFPSRRRHTRYWRDWEFRRVLFRSEDGRFFREVILPRSSIWVTERDRAITAFLAIEGSYVDRLYVHPTHQRYGAGSALIAQAKALSPEGVQLHTHQKNSQARAFYEKHGFRAVKFGISPPPESEPDVEYHWTPVDGG